MNKIVALLISLALLASTQTGWAQPKSQDSGPQEVAYGAGSFIGTLVYAPFKMSFCILGAITSGFALPIGGTRTAGNIAGASCKGSWVITPNNLRGREPVKFLGDT